MAFKNIILGWSVLNKGCRLYQKKLSCWTDSDGWAGKWLVPNWVWVWSLSILDPSRCASGLQHGHSLLICYRAYEFQTLCLWQHLMTETQSVNTFLNMKRSGHRLSVAAFKNSWLKGLKKIISASSSLKCSHPLEDPTVTDIFHSVTNYSVGKMADSLTAALVSRVWETERWRL